MSDVIVYRTWDESMAEMAIGLLRAEGIGARKLSEMPRSVYPVSVDGLGEIKVLVHQDEAEEALEILSARFSEDEADISEEETDFDPDEIDSTDNRDMDGGEN